MVVRADELRCEDGACEAAHLMGRAQVLLVRLAVSPSRSTTLAAEWGCRFATEKIGVWPTNRVLLSNVGGAGRGGLGERRRRRRWRRARPGDAFAKVNGNGGQGRSGGFGALSGGGLGSLGGGEDGRLDLGDLRLTAGGGQGTGAGHHGKAEGAAGGEAGGTRVWVVGFDWVLLGHCGASAARFPQVVGAGRFTGRGLETG